MNCLKGSGLKMWLYLNKNQDNYRFALSRVDCAEWGIRKDSYYDGIKDLIAKKKQYLSSFNAEDAQLGIFLKKWVSLERRINEITQQFGTWRTPDGKRKPVAAIREILPDEIWYKYAELRRFRNNLVHGQESPTSEDLETYTYRIEEILQELKNFFK